MSAAYCPACVPEHICYACGRSIWEPDHVQLDGTWWHEDIVMEVNDPDFVCPRCGSSNA